MTTLKDIEITQGPHNGLPLVIGLRLAPGALEVIAGSKGVIPKAPILVAREYFIPAWSNARAENLLEPFEILAGELLYFAGIEHQRRFWYHPRSGHRLGLNDVEMLKFWRLA